MTKVFSLKKNMVSFLWIRNWAWVIICCSHEGTIRFKCQWNLTAKFQSSLQIKEALVSFCTKAQKKSSNFQGIEPHKGKTEIWLIPDTFLLAQSTLMKNLHSLPCTLSIYLFVFLLNLQFKKPQTFISHLLSFLPAACRNPQWPITCVQ